MESYESYVIGFGKYRDRKLTELTDTVGVQYVDWLVEQEYPKLERSPSFDAFKWWQSELKKRAIIDVRSVSNMSRYNIEAINRFRDLEWETRELARRYAELQKGYQVAASTRRLDYPPIPSIMVHATPFAVGVPSESGVYFVWYEGSIAYVGQSIRLSQRCTFGHDKIREGDQLSWVLLPVHELNFAEAFYICTARPWANFGKDKRPPKQKRVRRARATKSGVAAPLDA